MKLVADRGRLIFFMLHRSFLRTTGVASMLAASAPMLGQVVEEACQSKDIPKVVA